MVRNIITLICVFTFVLCSGTASLLAEEGTLVFSDGFTNGISTNRWRVDSPHSWRTDSGVLCTAQYGGEASIVNDLGEDIRVEAWVKPIQANPDLPDGYSGMTVGGVHFTLRPEGFWWPYLRPGTTTMCGGLKSAAIVNGKWYQFKIIRRSCGLFQWFVNGEKVCEFVEPGMPGGVSLSPWRFKTAYDNISVWQLSACSHANANLLRNSSFETMQDNLAPYWRPGIGVSPGGTLDEFCDKWRMDGEVKYEGLVSLRLEADSQHDNGVNSYATSVQVGKSYVYSVYMKSDRALPVRISVAYLGVKTYNQVVNTTTNWQRYAVAAEGTNKAATCGVSLGQEGVLWVDAAQLEEGTNASAYHSSPLDLGNEGNATNIMGVSETVLPGIAVPPVLDGRLDDAAWQQATQAPPFMICADADGGRVPTEGTEAYLCRDDENLYIGFKCHDSQMESLAASITNRDGLVWLDECVEVYVDTRLNRQTYYHLAVNPLGTQYDAENLDGDWTRDWLAKIDIQEDGWTAELALPLAGCDVSVLTGTNWGINLCRQNHKAGEYSCTSPVRYMDFADVARYGVVTWAETNVFPRYRYAVDDLAFLPETEGYVLKGTIRNVTPADATVKVKAEVSGTVLTSPNVALTSGATQVFSMGGFPPQGTQNVVRIEVIDASTLKTVREIHSCVKVAAAIDVLPGLSYYTSEDEAKVYAWFGLWEGTRSNADVILELKTTSDAVLISQTNDSPSAAEIYTISLRDVPAGDYEVLLRLQDESHQEIASGAAILKKLAPRENEVKIDQIRRVILVEGQPFMVFAPLETFSTNQADINQQMSHWASNGFSSVACWLKTWESWSKVFVDGVMDAAQAEDMKVIFWLGSAAALTPGCFEYSINEWKDASALLAWGVVDEPESGGFQPGEVTNLVRIAKDLDPYHPVYVNNTTWGLATRFAGMPGDIVSIDDYFVPKGTEYIKQLPKQVEMMEQVAVEKHVPTWIWLEGENLQNHYREPTAEEQEAQTYGSLIAGATGLKYFFGQPLGRRHWEKYKQLNREVTDLSPILFSPGAAHNVKVSSPSILTMAREHHGAHYVVAVNVGDTEVAAAFDLAELAARGYTGANVLFEDRSVTINGARLEDVFTPYQRHVYEIQGIVKSNQTITGFTPAGGSVFSMTNRVGLWASADSGLPVTNFAVVSGPGLIAGLTNLTFTNVGMVAVTARQDGNTNWNGTPTVTNGFAVNPADQAIAFGEFPSFTYGDSVFSLTASASSDLPVSYASDNVGVAAISNSALTIMGAGTALITASQAGDSRYFAASNVTRTVTVSRRALVVRAKDKSKPVGQANPPFDAEYTGLVGSDTPASIGLTVTFACAADSGSPRGAYTIEPSGGTSTVNYTVTYEAGTLTVSEVPTIVQAAQAVPNPVTDITTALSVRGDDDGGETYLTYTWSAVEAPPAPVTFSVNGSNSAKNATAMFSKAGAYTLQAVIMDAVNLSVTSRVPVTVSQAVTTIAVRPASAGVAVGGARQFMAEAKDQFGETLSGQPTFNWSVSGGGTIHPTSGLYTATTAGGPYTVTATGGGKMGTANVTVGVFTNTPTHHVSPGGGNLWPYTNWVNAANGIQDAIDAATAGDTVLVTNGAYILTNTVIITNAITLRSLNAGAVDVAGTLLDGNYPNAINRCLYMSNAAAVIDGFTLTNGYASANSLGGHGGGIYLCRGTVTNCWIVGNRTPANGHGGGVYINLGGTVASCRVYGNLATNMLVNNSGCLGGGLYLYSGGVVANCTIMTNRAYMGGGVYLNGGGLLINSTVAMNSAGTPPGIGGNSGNGGGVFQNNASEIVGCMIVSNHVYPSTNGANLVAGGVTVGNGAVVRDSLITHNGGANYGGGIMLGAGRTVSNCVIRNNSAANGGGVYLNGGLATHCTIVSNSSAVFGQSGTVRNCLIAYNGAGIWAQSGAGGFYQNCTVASNGYGIAFSVPAIMENSIVYYNGNTGTNFTGNGVWTNSCTTPLPTGGADVANISSAPQFVNRAAGNFRLLRTSPCINGGVNRAWMSGAVDLDGGARVQENMVDMGAFENAPQRSAVISIN